MLAALIFGLGLGLCRANLGESEAQCGARYGGESDERDNLGFDVVGDKSVSFHPEKPRALLVSVTFLNGADCHEKISSADSSRGLSEDQMKAILDSESAGQAWTRQKTAYRTDRSDTTYGSETWLRSDGATATFWLSGSAKSQTESGEVELSTRDYAAAQRALDRQNGAN
jgi:hypothetical protein